MAVNAPGAGTIKELLANEEDTVTVGQDLVRLELGAATAGKGIEKIIPKDANAASQNSFTTPDPLPSPRKSEGLNTSPPEKPEQISHPKGSLQSTPSSKPKSENVAATLGSREERRVSDV